MYAKFLLETYEKTITVSSNTDAIACLTRRGVTRDQAESALRRALQGHYTTVWTGLGDVVEVQAVQG